MSIYGLMLCLIFRKKNLKKPESLKYFTNVKRHVRLLQKILSIWKLYIFELRMAFLFEIYTCNIIYKMYLMS